MYIQELTENEILGFIKYHYTHMNIKSLKYTKAEKEGDMANFEIKVNSILSGDYHIMNATFGDFNYEITVDGKKNTSLQRLWPEWVISVLKLREISKNFKISSDKYTQDYKEYKRQKINARRENAKKNKELALTK